MISTEQLRDRLVNAHEFFGMPSSSDLRMTGGEHQLYAQIAAEMRATIASEEERNRELTRQVEQLQARVDAAEKLAKAWRDSDDYGVLGILIDCADQLQQALTAPPSSSDPGRADTDK